MPALGWKGPDILDGRDFKYSSIRFRGTIPNEVDLVVPPVQDQFNVGSCVFKGITLAAEVAQVFGSTNVPYYLSALDAYYDYRLTYDNVHVDDGAYIRLALERARKRGLCRESVWPYGNGENWDKQPPVAPVYYKIYKYWGLDGNSKTEKVENIIAALASGVTTSNNKVIVGGFSLYESFLSEYTEKTGKVDMPNYKAERFIGGHCMVIKGYSLRTENFIVRNSWGPWGYNQSGDCFMPFGYIADLGNSFYIIDIVT